MTVFALMPARDRCPKSGFTLVEMLVVLVLVGLMAAMTAPLFSDSAGKIKLKSTAKKVGAALRYARNQSVVHQDAYLVRFLFRDQVQTMTMQPASSIRTTSQGEGPLPGFKLPPSVRIDYQRSAPVDPDDEDMRVYFYPNGTSSGAEIVLRNEEGKRYALRVDFVTGAVQLESVVN